jgi:hypothetical protein
MCARDFGGWHTAGFNFINGPYSAIYTYTRMRPTNNCTLTFRSSISPDVRACVRPWSGIYFTLRTFGIIYNWHVSTLDNINCVNIRTVRMCIRVFVSYPYARALRKKRALCGLPGRRSHIYYASGYILRSSTVIVPATVRAYWFPVEFSVHAFSTYCVARPGRPIFVLSPLRLGRSGFDF